MPKLNPYLENKKPIELVQELKNEYKVPSYEEFLKNYKPTEEAEMLAEAEYQDRVLNGPRYGPGSSQSSYSDESDEAKMQRYCGKATTSAAASIVTRAAGPAGVIASGITGAATTVVSEIGYALSSDSDTKDAWKYASEVGQDMMTGFVVGNFVDNMRLPYGLKKGWDLWQDFEEKGGKNKLMVNYHTYHITNGEKYSSYCDVCKS